MEMSYKDLWSQILKFQLNIGIRNCYRHRDEGYFQEGPLNMIISKWTNATVCGSAPYNWSSACISTCLVLLQKERETINQMQFKQSNLYWNLLHNVRPEQLETPFNLNEYNYLSLIPSNSVPHPRPILDPKIFSVPTFLFYSLNKFSF